MTTRPPSVCNSFWADGRLVHVRCYGGPPVASRGEDFAPSPEPLDAEDVTTVAALHDYLIRVTRVAGDDTGVRRPGAGRQR